MDWVAVVTSLHSDVRDPIAAASQLANADAAIGLELVPIIAGFNPSPGVTITAACCPAVGQTGVGLNLVTVVAFFYADLGNTVAAARLAAAV